MWKRLRRRTFAVAAYPDQIRLLIFTVVRWPAGIYVVARFLL